MRRPNFSPIFPIFREFIMGTRNRTLLEVFLAASFGLAVVVIPVALDPNARQVL